MNNLSTRFWSFVFALCFTVVLHAQDQDMTIEIQCSDGLVNTTKCFDFVASAGTKISAMQFTIAYDPNVLDYQTVNSGGVLSGLTDGNFNSTIPGTITFVWFDDTTSFADGTVLFSLCFEFVGFPGSCTDITIVPYPTDIDVVSDIGNVDLTTIPCEACVLASQCTVVTKYCNPTTSTSNDGSITFYAVGGTGPYSYSVSPSGENGMGLAEGQQVTLPNLGQGVKTITITDALGCMSTKPVSIADIGQVKFDVKPYLPSCFNRPDGQIKLNNIEVTNIPYKIKWNIGYYGSDTIPNVLPGKYYVTVTDDAGCERSEEVNLMIDTLKFSYTIVDSALCLGQSAVINVNVSGGTPYPPGNAYEIRLNNGAPVQIQMPATFPTIPAGKNTFIISDNAINFLGNKNPCVITEMINVPYKNKTVYTTLVDEDVECKGELTGHIEVEMSGVGNRYRIIKAFNETLNANMTDPGVMAGNIKYINNTLGAGDYYIITSSTPENCRDTFRFSIAEPDTKLLVSSNVTDANCAGPGSISINSTGGVAPYAYTWSDIGGPGPSNRNGLPAGDYIVTVTDDNNCDTILTLKINDNGVPQDSAQTFQAITCKDLCDGAVTATQLGTGSYSYTWRNSNGTLLGNTKTITNLCSGWYFVTITVSGCSKIDSVFLINPDGLRFVDVEAIIPECPGIGTNGSLGVTIEGGSPSYKFAWSQGGVPIAGGTQSVLANIEPGTYDVRVSDFSNCFIDTTLILDGPADFVIDLVGKIDVSCNGLSDGKVTAMASSGPINNGRYSFFWSSGEVSPSSNFNMHSAVQLSAGQNWVFVTDSKCQSDTLFFNIADANPIVVNSNVVGLCSGSCNGQIQLTLSGGTANNTFKVTQWPDINQTGNTLFNLCAGSYAFIVEDNNGCTLRDTVVITESDTLKVTLDESLSELLSCKNAVGQLALKVEGGLPTYSYNWTNNASQTAIASNLSQGIYNATVTDQNGCSATFTYTLTRPNAIEVEFTQPEPPSCFGGKTCIKIDTVTGGVGNNYTIQINNGLRIPVDSCFETFAGEYLINVYDADGCKSEDIIITIDQPNPIVVDLGEDIELNLGEESPLIESFVAADETIVNYTWSGIDSVNCQDELCSAISIEAVSDLLLRLVVLDENGCTGQDEKRIFVSDKRNVYIPNIFKTTGSPENSKFDFKVGFGVQIIDELIIYDRWGSIVYSKYNYMPDESSGWDGIINGQQALPGVYVYNAKVSFVDGQSRIYKGDITLIK